MIFWILQYMHFKLKCSDLWFWQAVRLWIRFKTFIILLFYWSYRHESKYQRLNKSTSIYTL